MLRFAAFLICTLIGVVGLAPEAAFMAIDRSPLAADLPDGAELKTLTGSCQVTSEFGFETVLCPQALSAEDFSPHLYSALIASEDHRFLSHGGVDPIGVYRALLGLGHLVPASGGSTITQQLARTLFLGRDVTFARKAREWVLARRIERVLDKPEIVTRYLNVAPQGHGLFGFDAAARYYLGISARDLSVMQAALLVSMLPLPIRDPAAFPDSAYRATIDRIALMEDQRFITAYQAARARAEAREVILGGRLPAVSAGERALARRPFEFRRVRDLAREQIAGLGLDTARTERLFLTIDPRFQRWADEAADAHPAGYGAAALFMSPGGDILAIGGPSYGDVQYNAAFQAQRSLGSLGKVPLYILAHERPDLLARRFSMEPLKGHWPSEPSRNCRHVMRLPEALAYSCNRPFTRLAATMPRRSGEFVASLGLSAPDNPLLTPLGGVHGNLLSVTRLFAAIANGGSLVSPRTAVAIMDGDGKATMVAAAAPPARIMAPEVARAVAADLRGPVTVAGGTARRAAGPARAARVAGKTGTSDGNRDAWFVGFTSDFVGGIWAYATAADARPTHGGGYPAEQFGRIVDRYWIPRNAEAAMPARNFNATPQAEAFRWRVATFAQFGQTGLRLVVAALLLMCGWMVLMPSVMRLRPRLPRASWEGRFEVPPGVMQAVALRP